MPPATKVINIVFQVGLSMFFVCTVWAYVAVVGMDLASLYGMKHLVLPTTLLSAMLS